MFQVAANHGFDVFEGGAGNDTVLAMADNVAIGLAGNYVGTVEEFSAGGKAGVTIQGDWTSQTLDFSTTLLTGITAINGGDGNDTITGSAAGDVIIGGAGNDTLRGFDGNDVFQVGLNHGFDAFEGGAGYDVVLAMADNVAIGLSGNYTGTVEEFSAGGKAGVTIQGDWTSQTLDFSTTLLTGITAINGGDGNDTITGSAAGDVIIGGSGNDTLRGFDGNDVFQVAANHGFDVFEGGAGNDTVLAMADNVAIGLSGNYTGTVEEFSAGGKAGVTIQGDWTSQTLDFSTTLLTGITAINGGDGNDTITGSAAGDVIIGGAGNDTLRGFDGNDVFQVGLNHGFDAFEGGAGYDVVLAMADNVAIGLSGNYTGTVEEFSAGGKAGVTIQGDWTSQTLDFSTTLLTGITAINGGDGNDTITGFCSRRRHHRRIGQRHAPGLRRQRRVDRRFWFGPVRWRRRCRYGQLPSLGRGCKRFACRGRGEHRRRCPGRRAGQCRKPQRLCLRRQADGRWQRQPSLRQWRQRHAERGRRR